jgi:hypothetical protein
VDGDKVGKLAWKPLFFIIGANLVWHAAGRPAQLRHAGHGPDRRHLRADLHRASLAGDEFKFKEVLILATVLAGQLRGLRLAAQAAVPGVAFFITG